MRNVFLTVSLVIIAFYMLDYSVFTQTFGDLTKPVVQVKNVDRVFLKDGTPSNTLIEYIYNSRNKTCFARVTENVLDSNVVDTVKFDIPSASRAASPTIINATNPTPNTANLTTTTYYFSTVAGACK